MPAQCQHHLYKHALYFGPSLQQATPNMRIAKRINCIAHTQTATQALSSLCYSFGFPILCNSSLLQYMHTSVRDNGLKDQFECRLILAHRLAPLYRCSQLCRRVLVAA